MRLSMLDIMHLVACYWQCFSFNVVPTFYSCQVFYVFNILVFFQRFYIHGSQGYIDQILPNFVET